MQDADANDLNPNDAYWPRCPCGQGSDYGRVRLTEYLTNLEDPSAPAVASGKVYFSGEPICHDCWYANEVESGNADNYEPPLLEEPDEETLNLRFDPASLSYGSWQAFYKEQSEQEEARKNAR